MGVFSDLGATDKIYEWGAIQLHTFTWLILEIPFYVLMLAAAR